MVSAAGPWAPVPLAESPFARAVAGDSVGAQKHFAMLLGRYTAVRPCEAGDASGFLRAAAFAIFESILASDDPPARAAALSARIDSFSPDLEKYYGPAPQANLKVVEGMLAEITSGAVVDLSGVECVLTGDRVAELAACFRAIAAIWMQRYDLLFGLVVEALSGRLMPVAEFCASEVLPCDREFTHAPIVALCQALAIELVIEDLNDAPGAAAASHRVSPAEGERMIVGGDDCAIVSRGGQYGTLSLRR